MKYIKRNKYDVYNKIIKIIDSCSTAKHCWTVARVINNFLKLYNDAELYYTLMFRLNLKFDILNVV